MQTLPYIVETIIFSFSSNIKLPLTLCLFHLSSLNVGTLEVENVLIFYYKGVGTLNLVIVCLLLIWPTDSSRELCGFNNFVSSSFLAMRGHFWVMQITPVKTHLS